MQFAGPERLEPPVPSRQRSGQNMDELGDKVVICAAPAKSQELDDRSEMFGVESWVAVEAPTAGGAAIS